MKLIENWKRLWLRLWSVRLALLAGILSGLEAGFQYWTFGGGWIAGASCLISFGAAFARIVAQPALHE